MNKKEELLALIHGNGYRGMHAAQLSRALDMEDSASFTQLMKLLNDLEAEHILARDAKERYFTSEELGYVTGNYASIRKASALWKQRIPAII